MRTIKKEVQIIISAKDFATSTFRTLAGSAKKNFNSITSNINQIADAARGLTVPAGIAGGAMIAAGNNFVDAAYKAQVGSKLFKKMVKRVGEDYDSVSSQLNSLADELRIPQEVIEQNAKDLLRNGYTFKQISDIYRGAAASGVAVGKSTTESIEGVTDALVTQLSTKLNHIGIVENLSTAYTSYSKTLDKTSDELTKAERAEAAHLMIMQATASEVEDLPEMFEGYGGAVADYREEMYKAKIEAGQGLLPVWTKMISKGADILEIYNDMDDAQKDVIWGIGKIGAGAIATAAALGLVAQGASIATKSFSVLSAIASIAINPLVLGGAAIAGAGYAIYKAWDSDWEEIQTKLSPLIENVKDWASIEGLKKALDVSITATGEAWEWLKNTDIGGVTEATLNFAIKASGATYDFIKNAVTSDTAKAALNLGINFAGSVYDDLKEGNTNSALGLVAGGMLLKMGINVAQESITSTISAIGKAFGNTQLSKISGTNATIATLSVGIALKKAIDKGDYTTLAEDMVGALSAALITAGLTKNPNASALAFTIALNFQLGSKLQDLTGYDPEEEKKKLEVEIEYKEKNKPQPYGNWGTIINSNGNTTYENDAFWNWIKSVFVGANYDGTIIPGGRTGGDQFLSMVAPGEAIVPNYVINGGPDSVLSWFSKMGVPGFYNGRIGTGITGVNMNFDDVQEFIAGIADNFGSVTDMITNSLKILSEVFINIADVLGQAFGVEDLGQKIRDSVQSMLDAFSNQRDDNGGDGGNDSGENKDNKELIENQKSWFQELIDSISDGFSKILGTLSELSSFTANMAQLTGSEGWGTAASVIGGINSFGSQLDLFKGATGLSKLTAGLGMGTAIFGVAGAVKGYFDSKNEEENQRQDQLYQEQIKLSQKQLELISNVADNTKDTANNIVKAIANNPTLTNISEGQDLFDNLAGLLSGKLSPDFSQMSMEISEDRDGWLSHGDERNTYISDPIKFLQGYMERYRYVENENGIREREKYFKKYADSLISDFGIDSVDGITSLINLELDDPIKQLRDFNTEIQSISEADFDQLARRFEGDDFNWQKNDFSTFQEELDNYTTMIDKLYTYSEELPVISRLESFEGIDWMGQQESLEAYTEQIEEMYRNAGLKVSDYREEIDSLAAEMADSANEQITIMQNIRQSFIDVFSSGKSIFESITSSMQTYFDSFKSNIASMVYGNELDKLNSTFEDLFSTIMEGLANYNGTDVLSYVQELISGSDISSGFNQIIQLYQKEADMDSINEMLAEMFTEQAEAAGLSDSQISEAISDMGLAAEDAAESLKKISESLSNTPTGFALASYQYGAVHSDTLPSLDVGGTIYGDGVAKVHKGEVILNEDQQSAVGGDTIIIQAKNIWGYDDFSNKVNQARDKHNRNSNVRSYGSPVPATSPYI